MKPSKILGIVLLVAGVLALVFGGIPYAEKHTADLGPLDVSVKEEKRVALPVWLGVGLVVLGGGLLLVPGRR
jgi:hypothetical protein